MCEAALTNLHLWSILFQREKMSDEQGSTERWENEGGRHRKTSWPTAKNYESKNSKGGNRLAAAADSGDTFAPDHKSRLVDLAQKRKG